MTYNSEAVLQDGAMVLTVCPKCRHEFPPTASPLEPAPLLPTPPLASSTPQPSLCPCDVAAAPRAAPSLGGAAPAAWLPPGQPPGRVSAPSPTPTSAMLSLSITASSAASLNGGHVVVKTTPSVSAPSFSVTATLPAVAPMWAWSQPAPAPLPAPSLAPAPAWTLMPSASLPWAVPPQPSATWAVPPQSAPAPAPAAAPLTLGLELFHAPVAPLGAPMGALGIARPRHPQPQPPCGMKGAQFRLTGGGILHDRGQQEAPVLLQPRGKPHPPQSCGSAAGVGVAPEQSPSTPLSFVLPGGVALAGLSLDLHALVPEACPPPARQPAESPEVGSNPEAELRLLQATTSALKASGWYYEGFSWQESADTLRDATPGTFLVRDSSDPRFLFSLSVQTDRGPTSVRLLYVAGGFRLDAEPHLAPTMPLFPCVLQLIEHYMDHRKKRERGMASAAGAGLTGTSTSTSTSASRERSREQVWVDARGQVYSHILLTAPRRHTVPGLQHLARLAVHKQLKASATAPMTSQQRNDRISKMELPTTLCRFLEDYPYTL